jgi:hypothetical protein
MDEKSYLQGREINVYQPFERFDQDTFLKTVMSINVNDADSALNFYNQHGILGFDGIGVIMRDEDKTISKRYGINMDTTTEEYRFFKQEITILQRLIKYHEAVSNNDFEYFRKLGDIPAHISDKKVLEIGKKALMHKINLKLDLIQPVIMMSAEGEFYKGTTTTCLLGVFYFRLYEIVTENQKMNKCRYCGDYFIPRKANANFCPPPEANERSKCANRYDAMVRRIAEWHYKDGLSVEEIQKKLTKPKTRTIKEIEYILSNYKGKLKK